MLVTGGVNARQRKPAIGRLPWGTGFQPVRATCEQHASVGPIDRPRAGGARQAGSPCPTGAGHADRSRGPIGWIRGTLAPRVPALRSVRRDRGADRVPARQQHRPPAARQAARRRQPRRPRFGRRTTSSSSSARSWPSSSTSARASSSSSKPSPRGEAGDKTVWTHPVTLVMLAFVVTSVPILAGLDDVIKGNLESLTVFGASLLIGGIVMWVVDAYFGRAGRDGRRRARPPVAGGGRRGGADFGGRVPRHEPQHGDDRGRAGVGDGPGDRAGVQLLPGDPDDVGRLLLRPAQEPDRRPPASRGRSGGR